jgi:hypothetical protein
MQNNRRIKQMNNKKIYIDDLIREGNDAKALQYLAKELYEKTLIGGTRKRLMDRVADKLKELEKENTNLKYKIDYISEVAIQEKEQYMEALRKCNPS